MDKIEFRRRNGVLGPLATYVGITADRGESADFYPAPEVDALVEALREIKGRAKLDHAQMGYGDWSNGYMNGTFGCSDIATKALSAWEQSGNNTGGEEKP